MKNSILLRIAALCMAAIIISTPIDAQASTLLKVGSRGSEVTQLQNTLQKLGYYTYPVMTGYYGSVTKTAVKRFQKANGLLADGIAGKKTFALLLPTPEKISPAAIKLAYVNNTPHLLGDFDWFTKVRDIWKRGTDALVTDVETGKSFYVRRTYGTNHADIETLTTDDTRIMKEIWGGFSWKRRAVVVQADGYMLAGSMTAMPHAGIENKPAGAWVRGRSAGYGYGYNYDAIKGNGISGHMDIHFKNSKTHGTGVVQKIHQDMVRKAAQYIATMVSQSNSGNEQSGGDNTQNNQETQNNNDEAQSNSENAQSDISEVNNDLIINN